MAAMAAIMGSWVLKVPIKRILHEEAKLRLAQEED